MTEEEKIERVRRAMAETLIPGSVSIPAALVMSQELLVKLADAAITALEGLSRIQKEGGGSGADASAPIATGNNGPVLEGQINALIAWVSGMDSMRPIGSIRKKLQARLRSLLLPSPPIPETEKGPSHHVASPSDHVRDASNMIKGIDPELQAFLDKAREWDAKATPEEREAMMKAQRESYVRGEMGMGDDADEAEYRRRMDAGLSLHDTPSAVPPETEKNDG